MFSGCNSQHLVISFGLFLINNHRHQHQLHNVFSPAGHSVYKCNLGCRPQAHFHCFCEKLFLNRNQFIHHLNTKHRLLAAADPSVGQHPGVEDNDDAGHSPPNTEPRSNRSPACDDAPSTASSMTSVMPQAAPSHPSQQSKPGTKDRAIRAAGVTSKHPSL